MNVQYSQPVNNVNQYSINGMNTKISDNLANNMPNGLLRIPETKDTKRFEKKTSLKQNKNCKKLAHPIKSLRHI